MHGSALRPNGWRAMALHASSRMPYGPAEWGSCYACILMHSRRIHYTRFNCLQHGCKRSSAVHGPEPKACNCPRRAQSQTSMCASAFLRSLLHLLLLFAVIAENINDVDNIMNTLSAIPCVKVSDAAAINAFLAKTSQKPLQSFPAAFAVCFESPMDQCVTCLGVLVSQPALTASPCTAGWPPLHAKRHQHQVGQIFTRQINDTCNIS